jgi:hypothetical protein
LSTAILDSYIRMREHVVKPDPLGAVPKTLMERAMSAADVVQAHPWGAVRHPQRFVQEGGTVPELMEEGVHRDNACGREVSDAAAHIAAAPARPS